MCFYISVVVELLFNHSSHMLIKLLTLSAFREQEANAKLVNSAVALVLV